MVAWQVRELRRELERLGGDATASNEVLSSFCLLLISSLRLIDTNVYKPYIREAYT